MTPPEQADGGPAGRRILPPPLVVAASLIFVEGLATVLYGLGELVHVSTARLVMGLTTALFLVAYGVAHVVCAWGMRNLRPWSRGPMLLTQLIWLGLAWNFRQGQTLPIAIALAVLSLATLAGLLHPDSVDALNREEHRRVPPP